jgi:hypothetical protein
MPLIGWRDSSTGDEKTFEEWLAEAEAYGSALGLPYEVLHGMAEQATGKDRPTGISVTQLGGCLRKVELERLNDFYAEPDSTYPAFRGVLLHAVIEKHSPFGAIVEQRYFRRYKGVELSGQLDQWRTTDPKFTATWHEWLRHMEHVEGVNAKEQGPHWDGQPYDADECESRSNGALCPAREQPAIPRGLRFKIIDAKSKHEVPTFPYLDKKYQQQANVYIYLLRLPPGIIDVDFIFMSMKGVKAMSLYDGGTFRNGRAKPEQFWSRSELEQYLDNRLMLLEASRQVGKPVPYDRVDTDDLWNCDYCPAIRLCHKLAAEEARKAWSKGEIVDRLPPRNRKAEKAK